LSEYWDTGKKNVIIHGLAGIGKSSLVSYFLEYVLKILPARVFRHDFRLSPDFPSFARYLGNFLSLKPPASDDPQEYVSALINGLNNTNLTLFFDNFEDALREFDDDPTKRSRPLKVKDQYLSAFMDNLLRSQTGVNTYITSRYRPDFGVAGANSVEISDAGSLAGLDKDNSKKLLDSRMGGSRISEQDWEDVNQILNGHPAAIELLGQILKDQVYEIRDLIKRFDDLSATEQDTPFIERVAEDLFDTLYTRLSELEKQCLRRLCILRIPFDYTAAAALVSVTVSQAKENIDLLWKKNLLQRQTSNYGYHPLIQSYSMGLLNKAEAEFSDTHNLAGGYYLLLDQQLRPWESDSDINFALEAAHHLGFSNQENAQIIFDEVTRFLQKQGISYYLQGDFETSEKIIRKRIAELSAIVDRSQEYKRQYGVLHFYLANLLVKQRKRDDETRRLFQVSIDFAGGYAPAWQAWAVMESGLGKHERARELFQKATEADPKHAPAWQAWAVMESGLGKHERARELFQKATEVNQRDYYSWQAWAVMESGLGKHERARELFQKATEADPKHAPAWQAWAVMESGLGKHERARELFQKATEVNQRDYYSWQAWAVMESGLGKHERARELFQKATEVNQRDYYSWQAWAVMESGLGKHERAHELFQKATEADPKHAPAWQAWGGDGIRSWQA
jgi:tetratricopeptide (TPR) repeat protein